MGGGCAPSCTIRKQQYIESVKVALPGHTEILRFWSHIWHDTPCMMRHGRNCNLVKSHCYVMFWVALLTFASLLQQEVGSDPVLAVAPPSESPCGGEEFPVSGHRRVASTPEDERVRRAIMENSVAFSPNGRLLAAGSPRGVELWDMDTGKKIREFSLAMGDWPFISVAFSPDGKKIAAGFSPRYREESIRIWDVGTGAELRKLSSCCMGSIAFSPDGKTLLSGSSVFWAGELVLYDVDTGKKVRTLQTHGIGVCGVFSPDGKQVASTTQGIIRPSKVRLWNLATGREIRSFRRGRRAGFQCLAFSPDGRTLASSSGRNDELILLWDVRTGEEYSPLRGHTDAVTCVTFSPDSKSLASGSLDKTVRLWDLYSGKEVRKFVGHLRGVDTVAFSPDGKTLASGSKDTTVRLWDVSTGREIRRFGD